MTIPPKSGLMLMVIDRHRQPPQVHCNTVLALGSCPGGTTLGEVTVREIHGRQRMAFKAQRRPIRWEGRTDPPSEVADIVVSGRLADQCECESEERELARCRPTCLSLRRPGAVSRQ